MALLKPCRASSVHSIQNTHTYTLKTGVKLQWNKYIDVQLNNGTTQTLPNFFVKRTTIEDTHTHTHTPKTGVELQWNKHIMYVDLYMALLKPCWASSSNEPP